MGITLVQTGYQSRFIGSSPRHKGKHCDPAVFKGASSVRQRARECDSAVFKGAALTRDRMQDYDKSVFRLTEDNIESTAQNKSVIENSIRATAEKNLSGRLSFKGNEIKAATSLAERMVKSKYFATFMEYARKNPAVFEAVSAIGICCGLRPLAIMSMPKKDQDKNRKAASHSIASGIMGFIITYGLYSHFSKAVGKIEAAWKDGHPEKYFGKGAEYLTQANGAMQSKAYKCFTQLVTQGPRILSAFIPAAATISLIPVIDKYIIDKYIIVPKKDAQPVQMTEYDNYKYITFRSNRNHQDRVFQNFKGVMR